MVTIELGNIQKGLLQARYVKIDNDARAIKTDCTLLDISIYIYSISIVLISTYGLIKSDVRLLFTISAISMIVFYFIIFQNEKIMDNKVNDKI